ncbi:calcium binding protein 39 [Sarotherodon galilaeus]
MAARQDHQFISFSDDCMPAQLFSDIYSLQNCNTFLGNSDCLISDNNNTTAMKSSTAQWPFCPNTNSENDQRENVDGDNLNTANHRRLPASSQNYNHPGESCERDRKVKIRKSVSFDDDVIVYLFDQESPTLEMHFEPYTSLMSSYSCNQPGVTLEDNAFEWEDDFSALEKSCHFQYDRHSHPYSLLQTHNRTAQSRPENGCLPQTCLFLTYVTESDLE